VTAESENQPLRVQIAFLKKTPLLKLNLFSTNQETTTDQLPQDLSYKKIIIKNSRFLEALLVIQKRTKQSSLGSTLFSLFL
jgi:hypothetical protein